jgi:hypothetical protein
MDQRTPDSQEPTSGSRVSLLEADPEMGRLLPAKDRAAAGRVMLPVHTVVRDRCEIGTLLAEAGAIGLFVLEGTLFQSLRINDHLTLRLLGPGDLFIPSKEPQAMRPMQSACIASAATRLALLDQQALDAARRWPHVTATLLGHVAQQTERVALQLAIAHPPGRGAGTGDHGAARGALGPTHTRWNGDPVGP